MPSAPIASPCIDICEMDAASGLCRGCLRTLDEIGGWSGLSEADRLRIMNALSSRRGRIEPLPKT